MRMENISRNPILFHIILLIISLFGLSIRFIDYDRNPPFDATKDEFSYPWAGMTFIQTGVPKSWTIFNAYPDGEVVYKWDTWYRLVSPWLDKPPLYSLITGSWVLINGARDLFDVRLSVLRIIPISLSFFTIYFTGLLAKNIFSPSIGILASLLYASTPTIVLSNRLSLTENLLTPIVLATTTLFFVEINRNYWKFFQPVMIGLGSGLAILTKNIGVVLVFTSLIFYSYRKQWLEALIIFLIASFAIIVHPAIGLYYDWTLFTKVISAYRLEFSDVGPPELVANIFLNPIIERKNHLLLDGSILAGYIFFFTSPFWLLSRQTNLNSQNWRGKILLLFPFLYLTLLTLLASGVGFSFYGWHAYPLFPFIMILLAKMMRDIWQKPEFLKSLFFYLIIGSSTVRFLTLLYPQFQKTWQWILGILLLTLIGAFLSKIKYQRIIFIAFFILFLVINISVILNIDQIYPGRPQPFE